MKHLKLALAAGVIAFGFSTAHAQTYKTDFSTGIVLAGSGSNTVHTVGLNAGTPATGTVTFTLPNAYPGADATTYLLTSTTGGGMSWTDALTMNTFNSLGNTNLDVPASGATGTTNINAGSGIKLGFINIGNIGSGTAGTPDSSVTAFYGAVNFNGPVNIPAGDLNLGLANDEFYIGSSGGTATPQTITQDVAITNGGVATVKSASGPNFTVSHDISAGGGMHLSGNDTIGGNQDIVGGQHIGTNDTIVGTLYANGNANIDAGAPGTAGTITIGNNGLNGAGNAPADSSVTTMNGAVNFTGPVNIPAGDLNLGLANDEFYIGSSGGTATPQTITQDVAITNGGVATVKSASGPNFTVSGYQDVTGGQHVSGNDTVGGYQTIGLYQTITGGQQIGGNDTVLGTLYANGNANLDVPSSAGATGTTNINAGSGMTHGLINIGNNGTHTAGSPDSSVTTIEGAVNFSGPVNLPAGSIAPGSIPLANNDVFVGVGGVADSAQMTQDVTLSGATSNSVTATVNGSHAATFEVANAMSVAGQSTLGSTGLSNASVAAATSLVLDGNHSYYTLTGASAVAIGSISGTPAYSQGQILMLVNAGTANFTLSAAGLGLNGGDVIMTPGGTATLLFDGTNWRLIGAE